MTTLLRALALFPLFVVAFGVAFVAGLVVLVFGIDFEDENAPEWVNIPHRAEQSPAGAYGPEVANARPS